MNSSTHIKPSFDSYAPQIPEKPAKKEPKAVEREIIKKSLSTGIISKEETKVKLTDHRVEVAKPTTPDKATEQVAKELKTKTTDASTQEEKLAELRKTVRAAEAERLGKQKEALPQL